MGLRGPTPWVGAHVSRGGAILSSPGRAAHCLCFILLPVVLRPSPGLGPVGGVGGQGSDGVDVEGRSPAVLGVLRAKMGPMSPDLMHFLSSEKFPPGEMQGTSALVGGCS